MWAWKLLHYRSRGLPFNSQGFWNWAILPESCLSGIFWLENTSGLKEAFLKSILKALFRDTPTCQVFVMCQVPAPCTWISRCQVLCARQETWASGVSLKRALKMQFRNAYFRSLVHSSRKLWPKLGGSQNLMKGRYLSKTPYFNIFFYQNVTQNCLAFL